jgi:AraC-like DNA-binding protein
MLVDINALSMITGALIAQGGFAALILVVKRENRHANKVLALLTLFMSLWMIDTFFRVSGVYEVNPNLYFLPVYYSLAFGPLVYLYTLFLTRGSARFSLKHTLHFIPVLLQCFFYIYLQLQPYSFRRDFWFEVHRPYTYDLELVLSMLSLAVYLFVARRVVSRYRRALPNQLSNIDRRTLQWLKIIHVALFVLALIWFAESLGRLVWNIYPATPFSSISISVSIIVLAIGGILQVDLSRVRNALDDDFTAKAVDAKSSASEYAALADRLVSIMTVRQLYLRHELSLKEFAEEANVQPRKASEAINAGLGKSFIDFVNGYRIVHFKQLLAAGAAEDKTLTGLAFESGFNSKATFNRAFRKVEGVSPTEYLKVTQSKN